jgi:ribonuclease BN (tRNA processing enzyme)
LPLKVRILGAHNSETITARCTAFVVDDTLAIDAGALTSSLTLEEQKRIDTMLVTHAHLDHIKDIPLLALNFFRMDTRIKIYSSQTVRKKIERHLLNGHIYPPFHELPPENPIVSFHLVTPYKEFEAEKHRILALPVNHTESAVGYQVTDAKGKALFYTADTGPGLRKCWRHLSFELLLVETTLPNSSEEYARLTGHLTPKLLLEELNVLKKMRGDLPRVVIVHRDPMLGDKIKGEMAEIADILKTPITVGTEGMQLEI